MNTIKINSKNTQMIAHRGVSGLEPENSMPAFTAAGNRSYYGVETDTHVTADGQFVVIHDSDPGRVSGRSLIVEEATLEQLRQIQLYNLCGREIKAGLTREDVLARPDLMIPTLAEYISICKKYCKRCILELKNEFLPEDIRRLVAEIAGLQYLEQVTFISFKESNMVYLRKLLPEQELQFLVSAYDEALLQKLDTYDWDLDIYYKTLTKEIIDEVHAHGHKVNCWTVDEKETAEQLVEWGVDFITSNILE